MLSRHATAPQYRVAIALCVVIAIGEPIQGSSVSFQALGDLPGGLSFSVAWDISGDGSVVVGYSNASGAQTGKRAFRWTSSVGMTALPVIPDRDLDYAATAVSSDGAMIVGNWGTRPFLSTASGMTLLPNPPNLSGIQATGISANGDTIAGFASVGGTVHAVMWTSQGGIGLGDLPGGETRSVARGVSANGKVIVGYGWTATRREAFRWTSADGMVGLGVLPDATFSIATATSSDGSVVVGRSGGGSHTTPQVFRWTSSSGMVAIGSAFLSPFHFPTVDVSSDGNTIVGRSPTGAFLWTPTLGMVDLKDYLVRRGVNGLEEWTLNEARAVSYDGLSIVGSGTNPAGDTEAWLVTIPEPSSLFLSAIGLGTMAASTLLRRISRYPTQRSKNVR